MEHKMDFYKAEENVFAKTNEIKIYLLHACPTTDLYPSPLSLRFDKMEK